RGGGGGGGGVGRHRDPPALVVVGEEDNACHRQRDGSGCPRRGQRDLPPVPDHLCTPLGNCSPRSPFHDRGTIREVRTQHTLGTAGPGLAPSLDRTSSPPGSCSSSSIPRARSSIARACRHTAFAIALFPIAR